MKINRSIINKYTLSLFILLLCLFTDIVLHKGMSRVILPKLFTDKISAQKFSRCAQPLKNNGKKWVKAVNTLQRIKQLNMDAPGFEMDVYFDTVKNYLEVYHDSSEHGYPKIEEILKVYKERKLSSSIWLDFKNLSAENEKKSLNYILLLREEYHLQNKLIIESALPQYLQSFCDSGFFTSYYVPFFNPYQLTENELLQTIDTIAFNLKKYPVAALSGYYFQYPFLKKFFPDYPVLTWSQKSNYSLVSNIFNWLLLYDDRTAIVLYQ